MIRMGGRARELLRQPTPKPITLIQYSLWGDLLLSKYLTNLECNRAGISCPRSRLADPAKALGALSTMQF
jgi:hypothetical protein